LGSWSIPQGLIAEGETPLAAAKREFSEETGHRPRGKSLSLGEARQPGGKLIPRMGGGRRSGCGLAEKQYAQDGMAAAIRPEAIVFPKSTAQNGLLSLGQGQIF
jgi:hypothetical protein